MTARRNLAIAAAALAIAALGGGAAAGASAGSGHNVEPMTVLCQLKHAPPSPTPDSPAAIRALCSR
jgi:hypothetical protein